MNDRPTSPAPDRTGLRHLGELPEGRFRFLALDVETAGRGIGSICQIGLAFVGFDGRIATWSSLVDPCAPITRWTTRVHGLTDADVAGAPVFAALFPELRPVMEAYPVVQHSRYDERAFDAACRAIGAQPLRCPWVNSVTLARRAFPELRGNGGHGLANLKGVLGLDFRHHDAGEDARAAAQVALAAEARLGHQRSLGPLHDQLRFDF
ncbi:exonuclease domain-containing protein [uncultured Jannaschia sp.]|uniref:exonuclease domain-containing protein n=1 Tax=uncultured Jannaschia sp. TaxID=293347 RepID=UPI0026299E5A|nr:exonuclease domain-containing protein [uncultured Jannaschia sp.]